MSRLHCSFIPILLTTFILSGVNGYSFSQVKNSKLRYDKAIGFQRINVDSALIYIDSAFSISHKGTNYKWIGDILLAKAKIHLFRGEIDLAIEHALQADSYYSRIKYKPGNANANLLLAQGYSIRKKKSNSENCLNLASEYAEKHHLKQMIVEILICRGNTCFQYNDFKQALRFYHEAGEKVKSVNNLYLKTKIQNNIANILVNTGHPAEALPIYKSAIVQYKKLNQPLDELLVMYNIGRQFRLDNVLDSSLYYANLCLDLGLKVHSLEDVTYAYSALTETYILLKDYKNALRYNELMHIYQDSLQMNANHAQIMRLETDYQLRINREIILKQKFRLQQTKRKTTVALLALFVTTSLIIIGIFYFRKSRKLNNALKKSNSEIREQNNTIDKALYEKEILLKEVHHRVKNSLQIVSSLLNLQESQLTDEVAIEALRNSKTRIQTIALMHQSLYQREADLAKVSTAEYLQNILTLQLDALSDKLSKPKTQTDFAEQELSIDQAVPLGLIASEIINNALKHAYSSTDSPLLVLKTRVIEGKLELHISDNGKGFESDDFRNHSSLGLEIVEALNNQLHGEMKFHSTAEGTTFTFLFPID